MESVPAAEETIPEHLPERRSNEPVERENETVAADADLPEVLLDTSPERLVEPEEAVNLPVESDEVTEQETTETDEVPNLAMPEEEDVMDPDMTEGDKSRANTEKIYQTKGTSQEIYLP